MKVENSSIIPLVLLWIPVIGAVSLIYTYFRSWYRLREFNGPWLAGLTEAWLFRSTTTGELHKRLYDVNREYGMFYLICIRLSSLLKQ